LLVEVVQQYLELKKDTFEFEGQSYLFWEYVRLLKEIKPKYFFLENVMMTKEWERIITDTLGVQPEVVNSSLLSAQSRKRNYWTNIKNKGINPFNARKFLPKDRGIYLKDILEDGEVDREKSYCLTASYYKTGTNSLRDYERANRQIVKCGAIRGRHSDETNKIEQQLELRKDQKTNTITTVQKDNVIVYDVVQKVSVRKYDVDLENLKILLSNSNLIGFTMWREKHPHH